MIRSLGVAILAMALMPGCVDPNSGGGRDADPDTGPRADMGDDGDAHIGDTGPTCEASTERCNGADDDCDGRLDEGFAVGEPCTVEQNGCTSDGAWACDDDGLGSSCDAPPPEAEAEICDMQDNDCDGAADEDFDLDTAINHCGACNAVCERPNAEVTCAGGMCGLVSCFADFGDADGDPANGCECTISNGGAEACDMQDNDCDGLVDEGLEVGVACTAGLGVCAADGVTACGEAGDVICDADVGQPADEACNDLDDDCDGAVDEHLDRDGDGAADCVDCAPDDPSIGPNAPEICEDGVDQNCDGEDITCDVPAGRIDTLALATGANPNCRDIDGDGAVDNAFGNPVVTGLVNPQLQAEVDEGNLNLLPITPGLAPPGTDGVFDFGVLFGSDQGNRSYSVSADALDEEGRPVMLFAGTRIADGVLNAGPGTFLLTLATGNQQAELRIIETIITGELSVNDAGVTLRDGWVTGIVTEEDFDAALQSLDPQIQAALPFLVQPDIDRDGDGEPDAYSACVSAAGAPATLVNYPPQ